MPKVPEQYAAMIRENGDNPDDFIWDDKTQEAVHVSQAPSMGVGEGVEQGLRNVTKGFGGGIADMLAFGGRTMQGTSPIPHMVGSALRMAGDKANKYLDDEIYQDPRAGQSFAGKLAMQDIPQAVGQIGTTMIPSGAASGVGKLASMLTAGVMGGSQAGEDAARQVAEKNKREGKPEDTQQELTKGIINALGAGAVDAILGAGSLGRFLAEKGGAKVGERVLKEGAKGAIGEGIQQSGQDLLVEGAVDPMKALSAAIAGGVTQGGVGAIGKGLQSVGNETTPPEGAGQPATPPVQEVPKPPVLARMLSEDEKSAMISSPEWNAPNADPIDKAVKKAKSSKIVLTPERLDALSSVYDGTEESAKAIDKKLKDFYVEDRINLGPKAADDKAAAAVENLPAEMQGIRKEIEAAEKSVKNIAELKAKLQASTDVDAGTKWEMRGKYDKAAEMIRQKIADLHKRATAALPKPDMAVDMPRDEYGRTMRMPPGQHGPAIPGSEINPPSPVAPRFDDLDYRQWELPPGVQPAGLLPEITTPHPGDRPAGPAIPLDDPNHGLKAIQRARGDTRPMNPEIARILMEYANQEGEQRSPFPTGTAGNPPVVEPANVINEQLRLTVDKTSTKSATLVTPGANVPNVPEGLKQVETPHGVVIYNPNKTTEQEIVAAGQGKVFDATKLGMSATREGGTQAVTASTPSGKDVIAEVVNTPEEIAKAKAALKKAAPGADVKLKSVEDVLQEREQGNQEHDELPPEDRTYYFGFPRLGPIIDNLKKATGIDLNVPRLLNNVMAGTGQRLAKLDPAGALLAGKVNEMITLQRQLANTQYKEWAKIKKQINTPEFVKWRDEGLDTGTRDYTKLPANLQDAGRKYDELLKAQHDIQRKLEIYVEEFRAGKPTYREAQDVEGYALTGVAPEVYEASAQGSKAWAPYKKMWMDNWKKHKAPNAKDTSWMGEAEKALEDFRGTLAGGRFEGGEPLFNAVRRAHGIPLPIGWRSPDTYGSAVKFVDKWSKDLAWGHVIQKNPILRRYFGIKQDNKGVYTHETDPRTFKGFEQDFELAVREGKKIGADWVRDITSPEDAEIDVLDDKSAKSSIISSYTGRPLGGSMKGEKVIENANQLASAMIMQTKTGMRDFTQSVGDAWKFVELKDGIAAVKGMVDAISSPMQGIEKAKEAGAMTEHPMASEAAGVVSTAVYKAAHGLRQITGKNFLEEFGKSIAWHMFKETAKHQSQGGKMSDLIAEFGPNNPNMSLDEQATYAANALMQQIQPDYSFRHMPDVLIPQNRKFLGQLTGLLRWSVAKYNTWYESTWVPFMDGRPERLLKSVALGSVAAVATQEFLSWLFSMKPANVTMREWMNLPEDKKKSEFAPMFFAYHQAQGTFGIAGDIALQAANVYAGKPIARPELQPQIPAAIVATDLAATLYSFSKYTQEVGLNVHDLGELGMELMKYNQDIRALHNLMNKDKKPNYRERQLYEDIFHVSSKTGRPIVPAITREYLRQPFSLAKSLNKAETGEDFQRIMPPLLNRMVKGQPIPPVRGEMQDPMYYAYLREMYGEADARRMLEKDVKNESKAEVRRAVSGVFR